MAAVIPVIPAAEVELLTSEFLAAHYGVVAAAAFYVYDFVLTFGDEVDLIWNSRWTAVKVLFFISRYLALAYIITFAAFSIVPATSPALCIGLGTFSLIGVFLLSFIEVILQLRLFALYNYDKKIVIPVVTLFSMLVCAQLGMGGYEVYYLAKTLEGPDKILTEIYRFCVGSSVSWFYVFWITFMIFDFVVFTLAAIKSYMHYREAPDKGWLGVRLIRTLMRDSFIYFMINFVVFFAASVVYATGNAYLYVVIGSWQIVIPAVLVGRLVINARAFYQQPGNYATTAGESFHPLGGESPSNWTAMTPLRTH